MREKKHLILTAIVCLAFCSCQLRGQSNNEERQRKEPPSVDKIFTDMDKNEDGKLSKNEVKGPLSRDFDRVDANEDGFISREELEKAPKPKRRERPNKN